MAYRSDNSYAPDYYGPGLGYDAEECEPENDPPWRQHDYAGEGRPRWNPKTPKRRFWRRPVRR